MRAKNPYDIFEGFMLSNYIKGLLCVTICLLAICQRKILLNDEISYALLRFFFGGVAKSASG